MFGTPRRAHCWSDGDEEQYQTRKSDQGVGQAHSKCLFINVVDLLGQSDTDGGDVVVDPGRAGVGVCLRVDSNFELVLQAVEGVFFVVNLRVAKAKDPLAEHDRVTLIFPDQRVGKVGENHRGE